MKKKIKYLILTSLTAVLIFGTAISVNADECGTCGDNLTYTLDDEGTLTISGTGDMWSYVSWDPSSIKSVIINNGVTSIEQNAFYCCSNLTSITIPDSVTSIGYSAFQNCTGLTNITIPDSVTSIGLSAFEGCNSLMDIDVSNKNECYSSINGNVYNKEKTSILICAPGKENVIIPDGIISIGNYSFQNCTNLSSVTIPDSVISIGHGAFNGCAGLIKITIPQNVKSIGDAVFSWCTNLIDINVSENNTTYSSDNYGVLYDKNKTTLIHYPMGSRLNSFSIPDSVSSVGDYSFGGCTVLSSIKIPDSVTSIGNFSFYGCTGLTSVTIPNNVKSIAYEAFYNCSELTSITISDSVTSIGSFAFSGCAKLATVHYQGSEAQWNKISISSGNSALTNAERLYLTAYITYTGDYIGEETIECGNDVTLPTPPEGYIYTFTVNGEEWDGTNITSDVTVTVKKLKLHTVTFTGDYTDTITVPDGENAELPYNGYDYKYKFTVNGEEWDGTDITSDVTVTVKKVNVYHVYSYADSECDFYREVEENEDVELPEKGYNCRYVYMRDDEYEWDGKNVTSDIYLMIYKYDLVSSGKCGDNINYYLYDDGLLSIEGTGKMTNYSYSSSAPWRGLIKKVSISDGITSIGDYAFYSCTDLTSITIPDGVTSIRDSAFYDCDGLESIILPDSVTTIYSRAFGSCSNLSDIKIPNAVTSIGDYAFRWCGKLTSIFIPANVATIGDCAFGSTEINVDAQNKNYSSLDGVLFNKDRSILVQYPTGRNDDNYIIPNGVVTIADEAFAGSSLYGVVMPNSVTTIGERAFQYCYSLGSPYRDTQGIVMSDNIVKIGRDAFEGTYAYKNDMQDGVLYIGEYCVDSDNKITSCTIKDGTKLIADSAFLYYQSTLTSVIIPDSVKYIGESAFRYAAITEIIIPDSVTDIGAYAFTGCPNLTTAVIGKNAVNLGYWIFEECPKLENVTLRGTVIGPGMFSGGMSNYVGNIKKIVIPDGVTEIPEYAFRGCTKLESIEIPETVTKIGGQAFDGCYSLTEIVIPEGVTELNGWTFRECSKLESITLPGTITRISSAFEKCNNIKNIYFAGTKEEWAKFSSYYYFEKATVTFILKYTFEANGGSAVSSVTKEVAESPVTTCEGKTFLGWYDNAECSGTAITFPYSGEKTTLYAKWGAKVTFVGDLADEETVACGQDISLPTPPTGYTYSFTANGEKWDGTNVTENITVTVTKIPNKYTVIYVGDYAGTDVVNYSENATLPTPPEGYAYKFTVNGEPWDGTNITSEVTVTVTKLHDKCEIVDITDCYGIEVNSDILTVSTYFGTIGCDGISVSEGAAAKVYTNSACSGNPITDINTTGSSTTTVYVVVTAESGRSVTYTAKLTRTPVTSLGKIEFTKATGGHITLKFKDPVPGNPKILVATSKDGTNYTYSEAEYDPEERLIQLSGLEEQTNYFVKAAADYRDDTVTYPESGVIELTTGKTMSTACNITNIISPPDYEFDSAAGTIAATVANSYSEYQVRVEVSTDATWGLYLTPSAKTPLPENKLTLLEGRTTTAYIKVVAEDTDFTKTYTVNIYRQRKSAMPEISVVDGKVNITAPEGSTILYTTDKRDPIPGSYGETYTGAFTAEIGTVIKAIALNPNVEEYSDIAIFRILPDTAVIIDKLYVYLSGKNVDFSYYLMANNESDLCGTFYLAAYNDSNRLVGLYKEDVDKNDSEYNLISGMTVNETPAYFKAFFWDGIKPLRKNVTKDIPQ